MQEELQKKLHGISVAVKKIEETIDDLDFKNEFANYIEECCCYTGEQSNGVLKSTDARIYLFEVKVELDGSTF